MEAQLDELLDFLLDPKPEVRELASEHIKSFSGKPSSEEDKWITSYFQERNEKVVHPMMMLMELDWKTFPKSSFNSVSALTNLATDPKLAKTIASDHFLKFLLTVLKEENTVLADHSCMLISNLSKHEPVAIKLVKLELLEDLTFIFVRGVNKMFNKQATYDFLASVFANVSIFPIVRTFFLEVSKRDNLLPITRLMVFTEHESLIRRGGVISAIKNCCFDTKYHKLLLTENSDSDILPYLLLPLCGPEPFDDDDTEGMPFELQLLPDSKTREADSRLRLCLVEAILLLNTTRDCREILRARKVYPILKVLYQIENDASVCQAIDDVVQFLMRDEAKVQELSNDEPNQKVEEEEEEDLLIEEI